MAKLNAQGSTPVILIEPQHGWADLGIRELWAHRELLYFLVWRDLKVRYKQTIFGVAWAVLPPILLMTVFSVSLGRIQGVGGNVAPYPIFVLTGLVPWMLFSQSVGAASNSLVGGEAILTKVYFPRLLLPFAAVGSFLVDFIAALGVLVIAMIASGGVPSISIVWLPVFCGLVLVNALGAGTLLAAINVRYRDVKYAVPFLLQLWLFASPVVYAGGLIPASLRWLYALNPMTGAIEGFRWMLLGGASPVDSVVISAITSAALLFAALLYFRRVERTFADVI